MSKSNTKSRKQYEYLEIIASYLGIKATPKRTQGNKSIHRYILGKFQNIKDK